MLRRVPFFALFDDDELGLLASQVEFRTFAPRQRIYKIAASDIQGLAGKVNLLVDKVGDLEDELRAVRGLPGARV